MLDTLRAALNQPDMSRSTEIPLTIVRAQLDLGMTTEAGLTLQNMDDSLRSDWRHLWLSGVSNLLNGDFSSAQESFNEVLNTLPGEPAPKLALAATDELLLQHQGVNYTRLLDTDVQKALLALTYPRGKQGTDYSEVPGWTHVTKDPVALRFPHDPSLRPGVDDQPDDGLGGFRPGPAVARRGSGGRGDLGPGPGSRCSRHARRRV